MVEGPADQREQYRRLLRGEATVTFADGARVQARLLDISMNGLGLVLQISVAVGTDLKVSFLISDASHGRIGMEVRARVVNSILSGQLWGFRVGLVMLHIPDTQRAVLERYVLE